MGDNYHASWSPSANRFQINDNAKLAFGSQADSEFYHNGSNFYIQNDTGHIYIQNNVAADVDKNIYLQAKNGENSITCENDGEVYLFSNQVSANQQKLRTSNTGIYVTGIGTFTDKVSVTGSQNSMLTNNQLIFDRAGTSYIDNTNNSGSLSFRIGSSYTVGLFIDSSANVSIPSKLMHHGDTDTFLEFSSNTINFDTAGSERLRITSDGNMGVGNASPTQARLVVENSSGNTIAAVKSGNAGAVALGGPSQPRILMEAGQSSSDLLIYTAGGSSWGSPSWSEKFRIKSDGKVGVNVSNPSQALHVAGSIINSTNVNSTGDQGIGMGNGHRLGFDQSGTRSWTIKADAGNLNFNSGDGNGVHYFHTDVASSGYVDSASDLSLIHI